MPNADMFQAIKSGHASVVTDQIETFTEKGIQLRRELYTTDCGIAASLWHNGPRRLFANRAESRWVYTALNLG